MKKFIKHVCIMAISTILLYTMYIAVECVSLAYSTEGTKPLVVTSTKVTDEKVIYNGIGYKVKYSVDSTENISDDLTEMQKRVYATEVVLFDKILLFGRIE